MARAGGDGGPGEVGVGLSGCRRGRARSSRALALALALAIAGCGGPPAVTVDVDRNVIVKSNYDFIAEHWQEPKLAKLAREEDFSRITTSDEFGGFLALTDWTHRQWTSSRPEPYPPCNAVDILREIRAGRTGGFCGQYAYVLADVLKAAGFYSVRYVELWRAGERNESHFVVEAWSNQHAKWVVLDAHANVWYAFAGTGVPASAGEVRASLYGGRPVEARPSAAGAPLDPATNRDYYANIAVSLRSDLMRHAAALSVADRFATFLFYQDANTRAFFFEGDTARIPYKLVTGRYEDLYYDCNRARVEHAVDPASGAVALELFTDASMANFGAFAANVDGAGWRVLEGSRLRLEPGKPRQSVQVAPVNRLGRFGCVTTVTIVRG